TALDVGIGNIVVDLFRVDRYQLVVNNLIPTKRITRRDYKCQQQQTKSRKEWFQQRHVELSKGFSARPSRRIVVTGIVCQAPKTSAIDIDDVNLRVTFVIRSKRQSGSVG